MRGIFEASAVCRALNAFFRGLDSQLENSAIVRFLLKPASGERGSKSSVFYRMWLAIRRAMCSAASVLRLPKLFEGSIFANPFIWCAASVAAAPLLPTAAVIVLCALSVLSFLLALACDPKRETVYTPVNKPVLILSFIYIAATATSVTVKGSLYGGLLTAVFIFFTIVLINAADTVKKTDALIVIMVVSGTLVAAYGVYQYVFGGSSETTWVDADKFSDISTRVYSTLQNPNVLAEYLLLVIPPAFACAILAKSKWLKALFACAGLGMSLCLVLTFSRGGWLGFIIAFAVFCVLMDRRFILVGLAAIVALYFVMPDTIIDRFTSIGDMSDSSTSYRVSIWLGSISMLKDYWLCGVGPGTAAFNIVYPSYSYSAAVAQHAHNLYLQIMCETGIAGITTFIALVFVWLRTLTRGMISETDKRSKVFRAAFIAGAIGFLVQGFTDHSFYNYRVMLFFWAYTGLGMLVGRNAGAKEDARLW